jgi:elongator complex protein 2
MSVAATHTQQLIASSSKATKEEHAYVILWSSETWKQICKLYGHSLTVTKIRFSFDDAFLLTVSRDRSWRLYQKSESATEPYTLVCAKEKAHSRIIWDCSWTHDGCYFATASRDKTVKIWKVQDCNGDCSEQLTLSFEEAVTACDFASIDKHIYHLALGLENGQIILIDLQPDERGGLEVIKRETVSDSLTHNGVVKAVKWRPRANSKLAQLATAGEDHSVRIFSIFNE